MVPLPQEKRYEIDAQHSRVRLSTYPLQCHFIDEHIITFMKKARKGDFPGLFQYMAGRKSGKGGNPIPPSPKTFGLIESLLEAFPEHGCFGCAMGLGKG